MLDSLTSDSVFSITSPLVQSMDSNSVKKPVTMNTEDGEEIIVVEPTDPDEDRRNLEAVSAPASQPSALNFFRNDITADSTMLNQLIQAISAKTKAENTLNQAPRIIVTPNSNVLSIQRTTQCSNVTPQQSQASFMVQPLTSLQAAQLLNLSSTQPVISPSQNLFSNSGIRTLLSGDPLTYGIAVNCSTAIMLAQLANNISSSMLNLSQQCSGDGNANNMCLQISEINQLLGVLISLATSMSTSLPGLLSLRNNTNSQSLVGNLPQTSPILTSLISANQELNSTAPIKEVSTKFEAKSDIENISKPAPTQETSEPSSSSTNSGKRSPPVAGMLTRNGVLLKSVKIHSRPKKHICPYSGCGRAFQSRYNLVEHIRIHTGERPFVCPVAGCTSRFKRRRDLHEHSTLHEDKLKVEALLSKTKKTLLVTSVLPEKEKLEKPVNGIRTQSLFSCPFPNCNASYARRHRLYQHMCKHIGIGPVFCDYPKCTLRFFNAEDLKRHKISHKYPYRVDEKKNHICLFNNCGKVYSKMNKLMEHIRSHSGERPFVCDREGCKAAFSRQYGLKRHLAIHSSEKKEKVENPGVVADSTKPSLISSAPLVVSSSTPVFPQTIGLVSQAPPKPQTAILNLFQALTSSAPVQLQSIVTTAPKHTTTESVLNSASKLPPPPAKVPISAVSPPVTAIPNRSPKSNLAQRSSKAAATPSASALAEKALVVTCAFGKRRHVCPIENCQKVFPKLNKLREHICRHTGERPYACQECTATFVRMYDLRRHAQIHTRKKLVF
nr:zinc finger protein [Hymenolepis microstoma]